MKRFNEIERIPAPALIPRFGPLQGMRVLATGSLIGVPHAANMLADFGAEVIHVERPGVGDTYRLLAPLVRNGEKAVSASWIQDARNRLSMTLKLDMRIPEAKEVFLGLIKISDLWFENLVWLEKLGLSDEMCLEVNPKLVIVHVSGFGRPEFGGLPEICERGSYDMIGQAASGWLNLMGDPDPRPPLLARPWTNDYITGMFAVFGALLGYLHAQRTGQGQVIDVSQYEANARLLSDTFVSYLEGGILRRRTGNRTTAFQPYDVYRSRDGRWVALGAFGPSVYQRFVRALGLDPGYFTWEECASSEDAVISPKGRRLDLLTREWIAGRTAREVEEHMAKHRVPCSLVLDARDAFEHPHWQARENFVTYEDQTLKKNVRAFGVVPKLSRTPGRVWRGAPALGQDTEAILTRLLGYGREEVEALRQKGII